MNMTALVTSGIVVGIAAVAALFVSQQGSVSERTERGMAGIYAKVVGDAEDQYGIAKRQGDPIAVCVQAMSVAAANLQAKDEAAYRKWKNIEASDCERAGMPRTSP